jgi:hypothetical protein
MGEKYRPSAAFLIVGSVFWMFWIAVCIFVSVPVMVGWWRDVLEFWGLTN